MVCTSVCIRSDWEGGEGRSDRLNYGISAGWMKGEWIGQSREGTVLFERNRRHEIKIREKGSHT